MLRADGSAVVTLLTPAGALLDGDDIRVTVACLPGTDVTLRQTGATRLHRCPGPGIRSAIEVRIAHGARFRYLPFELIPFADSAYTQTIRLDLEPGARACVSEVVSPGRLQEHFRYRRLRLRTEAFLSGATIMVDAQQIEPGRTDCERMLGGFTHFGSLFVFGPGLGQHDADEIHERFAEYGVLGSASLLPSYGIGARVVGNNADPLLTALQGLPA